MTHVYLPALAASRAAVNGPGSAPWWWLAWVCLFVVLELTLYWRYGTPGTFSGLVWRWQDEGPGGPRWRPVRRAVLAAALVVLGHHLIFGW